jgi:hypothetical protein
MNYYKTNARVILCGVLLVAFFLPALNHLSAFEFIPLALAEASGDNGLTKTDALIVIFPLLMVALSAFLLALTFLLRIVIPKIYLAFPLIFLAFFSALIFRNKSISSPSALGLQAGFYIALLAALLLLFTKDKKQKSRRRRKRIIKEATIATEAL